MGAPCGAEGYICGVALGSCEVTYECGMASASRHRRSTEAPWYELPSLVLGASGLARMW